jgi:hypothetical protein
MPYPSPGMEIQGIKTEFHIFVYMIYIYIVYIYKTEFHIFVYTDKKVSLEMSIHKTINQF